MDKEQISAYKQRTATIEGIFVAIGIFVFMGSIFSILIIDDYLDHQNWKTKMELCMKESTYQECQKNI